MCACILWRLVDETKWQFRAGIVASNLQFLLYSFFFFGFFFFSFRAFSTFAHFLSLMVLLTEVMCNTFSAEIACLRYTADLHVTFYDSTFIVIITIVVLV